MELTFKTSAESLKAEVSVFHMVHCSVRPPAVQASFWRWLRLLRRGYALWNSCGCNSISKGCDTRLERHGDFQYQTHSVAGLDPSGRNRSYPSSRARKGESCDGGKRPADKRQRLQTLDNIWGLFETAVKLNSADGRREMYALARELSECQNLTDWIIKSQTENEGAQVSMACTQN